MGARAVVFPRIVLGHALLATRRQVGETSASMPTLFRFVVVLGLIASVVTGSLYVLAEYFQPEPKEISKSLRGIKARSDTE